MFSHLGPLLKGWRLNTAKRHMQGLPCHSQADLLHVQDIINHKVGVPLADDHGVPDDICGFDNTMIIVIVFPGFFKLLLNGESLPQVPLSLQEG